MITSKLATLGTSESVLIRGVATFQGLICIKKHALWDFWKWLEYRGGHISGVLIKGVPTVDDIMCVLYNIFSRITATPIFPGKHLDYIHQW